MEVYFSNDSNTRTTQVYSLSFLEAQAEARELANLWQCSVCGYEQGNDADSVVWADPYRDYTP